MILWNFQLLQIKTPLGERYGFDFVKTFVDGDEFVVEFKDSDDK